MPWLTPSPNNIYYEHNVSDLPVITDTVAMAVTTQMMASWLVEVTWMGGKRRWRPWLI